MWCKRGIARNPCTRGYLITPHLPWQSDFYGRVLAWGRVFGVITRTTLHDHGRGLRRWCLGDRWGWGARPARHAGPTGWPDTPARQDGPTGWRAAGETGGHAPVPGYLSSCFVSIL